MLKVKINDRNFVLDLSDNGSGQINGDSYELDIIKTEKGYHVIRNSRSYQVEIQEVDRRKKELIIKVNGHQIHTKVEDKYDELLKSLGMEIGAAKKLKELKAPMPGLVLEIEVKEGDQVNEKDPLLILEAMKMENVIKSPSEGVVKKVNVEVGKSVEKNQVLIEFE